MLKAFNVKKFAAAMTFACAGVFASAMPVYAEQDLRQELEQALSNMETVHMRLKELGHTSDASEGMAQIEMARRALQNTSDEDLLEASKTVQDIDALLDVDDMVLEALDSVAVKSSDNLVIGGSSNKSLHTLSSATPTTTLTAVDTENLEIATCQDQLALQASVTALDTAYFVAAIASEVLPTQLVALGNSLPNPLKIAAVVVKYAAKTTKFALEQTIKINAICLARNERKIAREYIQARQVRYTPHKTIEAKFDVVQPKNLGGNKKWRYTFWMHLTKDGRPTDASVTKVMASRLANADDTFVTMPAGLYTIEHVSTGMYKLTFDTPTALGLDYVRGFILHLESSQTSPGGATYKHYGVAHIRSDVNAKDF